MPPLLPRHGEVPSTRPFRMQVESLARSRGAAKDGWAHVTSKRAGATARSKAAPKSEIQSLRTAS